VADLISKLDELTDLVDNAKAVPLSSSCVLNRPDLLAALEELRSLLPVELAQASDVLADREAEVERGKKEAERIIATANAERARLLARTEVAQEAARNAELILNQARDSAQAMRVEVDDYVDAKLATFEVVLQKTLTAVERGREKLRGRHELDALRDGGGDDEPPLPT
jgi:cell division septum initiation protein DivIVA